MHREKGIERRTEYRHNISIDVKVITPKYSFMSLATNISGGGLELHVPKLIDPKTKLMVSLQLQQEFIFHGNVIWTLGDFVEKRWVYRVGIKTDVIAFGNTEASSVQEKSALVQKILPKINAKGAEDMVVRQMLA